MAVDKELEVLTRLFEDDDPVVVEAVNKRLISRGNEVLNDLTTLFYEEKNEEVQDLIGERLIILNSEFAFEQLKKILQQEDPDLMNGLFYASAIVWQDLDLNDYEDLICSLTDDMRREITDDKTIMEKLTIFNHIFYHRLKFTSRTYSIKNKKTSFLISVLKNRHGSELPVSLAYYLLARVVGLDVCPMVFPGGIVPCYAKDGKPAFYIDIVRGGEVFSKEMLMKFLENKGIDAKGAEFHVENDKVLIHIYLEVLYLAFQNVSPAVREILQRALKLFGTGRLLR